MISRLFLLGEQSEVRQGEPSDLLKQLPFGCDGKWLRHRF
jgi:hypothetical protein